MARLALAAGAAVAMTAVTLQGCGDSPAATTTLTMTTMTTTFACPLGTIPWPLNHTLDCQSLAEATKEANTFLKSNMPPWDVENLETLEEGIVPPTINVSLTARDVYPWAETIPKDIWLNYVLPYANVNEPRNDWRDLFAKKLSPLVQNQTFEADDIASVASILNKELWSVLRPEGEIRFKGGQTPLIYDPMSVIAYGYASCTGVSIMFVDALRSVGVPARIAGTPAWHGNETNGNHNWVEIWLGPGKGLNGEAWSFIESKPAGPGETLTNPCDKWFCNPAHFDGNTQAFAPQFDRQSNTSIYPMAWDLANRNVPGVNRTAYYNALCQPCGKPPMPKTNTSTTTTTIKAPKTNTTTTTKANTTRIVVVV